MTPFAPTQHDSTTATSTNTFAHVECASARTVHRASTSAAGSEANRKNRGPHTAPPYHAHHRAYTSTSPTTTASHTWYTRRAAAPDASVPEAVAGASPSCAVG